MKRLNVSHRQPRMRQSSRYTFWRGVAKKFMDAAKLYGEALEKNPADPTVWLNRAFTRMNLVSSLCSTSAVITSSDSVASSL